MKNLIRIEPQGEPGIAYHIDPAYICGLRENPSITSDNFVYINTTNFSIRVTHEELLRVKRQLLELNHPALPAT